MLFALWLSLHFTTECKLCECRDLMYPVTRVPTPRTYPGLEQVLKFNKFIKSVSKLFCTYFT